MNARILVLSDTHRDLYRQRQAVLQAGAVDYIFHLGDNVSDAAELKGLAPGAQLYCVRGNCDPGSSAPATIIH